MRHIVQRTHPSLAQILDLLDGAPGGQAFIDRAIELAATIGTADSVDHRVALRPHLWILERAAGDGLQLTAAGYLRPADVTAFADVLPTMRDWLFPVHREVDAHPVLAFREQLTSFALLRRYKGTLRASPTGRAGLKDPARLWAHLADRLMLGLNDFEETATVVALVHMATSGDRIDIPAVARTLTQLGWTHQGGAAIGRDDVYPVYNDLWCALGNVGAVESADSWRSRRLSSDAVALARDALFQQVSERRMSGSGGSVGSAP
jgi:hypothetical protein